MRLLKKGLTRSQLMEGMGLSLSEYNYLLQEEDLRVAREKGKQRLEIYKMGLNRRIITQVLNMICSICPHRCKVKREKGNLGFCKATNNVKVALFSVHRYEEPCISGKKWFRNHFFLTL